ncbi:rod shape-determining protein RodA [Qipengyuania atrilutea]|uniref:Rod shape-determining protein RodA n=1 Tax=Qipengyuania atrilutea TaxID=2744473 RepID=A0A850H494_9SPHN|nr:rod shape-determining protein RodA [Actirhodobacter atriluteus]NVD45012.1 rod shape-determining protein RodA [Actirhodobacter atriluteus]
MRDVVPPAIAALPWKVVTLLVLLASFGSLVLYSSAGGSWTPWALPHIVRFCLLLGAVLLIVRRLPLAFLRRIAWPAYIASLAMLILVELIGQVGGGSQRWLNLGVLTIQPSELMKIAIIISLARFYEQLPTGYVNSWRGVVPPIVAVSLPAILVLIQPDLDAAVFLLGLGFVMMFLAGLPLGIFVGTGAAALVAAPIAYLFLLEPYQQKRLLSFLNPESDPLGTGYHVIQSKIAIGSGGFWGRGFLEGSQARLSYLPEHHTDLVFAALAEEWGMIGGLAVLAAYFFLLRWGFQVAARAGSRFGKLSAMALVVMLFLYIAMNMLTATGLTPVMGMPLPLISHGGSAMLTVMIAFGILMAIDREGKGSRLR